MTTTDSNGLVQFQTTDKVEPLQTALNLITASVSNVLDGMVRTFNVPSVSARDALATSNPPTAAEPLLAWVQNRSKFYLNSGSGWNEWPPPVKETDIPVTSYAGQQSFGVVPKGGATLEVNITFGVTLEKKADWIPQISLLGPRHEVDRLTATIFEYTTTGMKVVLKNITSTRATKGTQHVQWTLTRKNP